MGARDLACFPSYCEIAHAGTQLRRLNLHLGRWPFPEGEREKATSPSAVRSDAAAHARSLICASGGFQRAPLHMCPTAPICCLRPGAGSAAHKGTPAQGERRAIVAPERSARVPSPRRAHPG
eukprot:scaffold1136_cov399-Prasinococcus_capsulatus_cf.AAC.5